MRSGCRAPGSRRERPRVLHDTLDIIYYPSNPTPDDQDLEKQRTRQLGEQGTSKFRGLDVDDALEMLVMLNAIQSLEAISPLKSVGLHPLKGDRRCQWAITVNGPWRICFRFEDGNAYDVEIVDYH